MKVVVASYAGGGSECRCRGWQSVNAISSQRHCFGETKRRKQETLIVVGIKWVAVATDKLEGQNPGLLSVAGLLDPKTMRVVRYQKGEDDRGRMRQDEKNRCACTCMPSYGYMNTARYRIHLLWLHTVGDDQLQEVEVTGSIIAAHLRKLAQNIFGKVSSCVLQSSCLYT